ncbi:MAG: BamA/TamA family outer membrane protein [Bacteroidetes bacterium]|nr:BamA/TamA family outer membrane protein [Bacteroidota bacterium]
MIYTHTLTQIESPRNNNDCSHPRFISVAWMAALVLVFSTFKLQGQEKTTVLDTMQSGKFVIVKAGNYDRSGIHNFLFGKHYRPEWSTPVKVPVAMLDTTVQGLSPYKSGGGRQSKSLHMHDRQQHEYVLRSLDKSFGRALPEEYRGTFVEDLIDDQVTIGHPYSAFTVPELAKVAKVYHTTPLLIYVPQQPALDSFNKDYGDRLYMLEQRPDENWESYDNFGNSKKIVSTDKMIAKVLKDNDNIVDQRAYIHARLLDFLIGDWSRHEDQWRWASIPDGDKTIYRPIPRDRDMAYSKFDGFLTKIVLTAANLDYLQSYSGKIDKLKIYGYTGRHLDRFCANEATLEDWVNAAREMQAALTDNVIDSAIRQMPPEVFPISGETIISKMKGRRDNLEKYAARYYAFLARHVDIPGTKGSEFFKVQRLDDDLTRVEIFNIKKDGEQEDQPYYSRTFKKSETKDVRLYGIDGRDKFLVEGKANKGIVVRIIGGPEADSIIDQSTVAGLSHKTNVYDDKDNYFSTTRETRMHLERDSAVHAYNYEEYEYHRQGTKLAVSYNNPDQIYVGIGYMFARHRWRKDPYGFKQSISLRYSLSQNAFSVWYEGNFYQAVGKWNIGVSANYDALRWTNFFGLGNETVKTTDDLSFYRLRTREGYASVGLNRTLGKYHKVKLNAFFQSVQVLQDQGGYISDSVSPYLLHGVNLDNYTGLDLSYTYENLNHKGIPTKGLMFYSGLSYTMNIANTSKGFLKYSGILQGYVPLIGRFSLSLRAGLTSVAGNPEFYQYPSVGGSLNLRGYVRDRFWGNTAFYNSNELRYIIPFSSYVMKGKLGLVTFVDDGRVWYNGESSDVWHLGYGGGILLAPFDRFTLSLTYGISAEDRLIHIRLSRSL